MYFEFSDLIRLETIRTISSFRRNFALIKCSIIQYTSFHSFKFEFFQLGKLSNDENKLFYVIYYVYTFHSHPLQITSISKKFSNRQITPRLNLLHFTYALEFKSFVSRLGYKFHETFFSRLRIFGGWTSTFNRTIERIRRVRKLHRVGARSLDPYSGGRSGECVGTDAAQNARFVRVACTGTCYRYYPWFALGE